MSQEVGEAFVTHKRQGLLGWEFAASAHTQDAPPHAMQRAAPPNIRGWVSGPGPKGMLTE